VSNSDRYQVYIAWDAPTRWFHWINAIAVLGLVIVGVIVWNDDALGLSAGGKILLKEIHVALGYVMVLNMLWRFVWAFFGNRYARWRAILPGGPAYWQALRSYVATFLAGQPQQYVGHNPAARISIALLLLLLVIMAGTGLILAGTDLFWPPLGSLFAGWVAAPGVDPSTVSPLAANTINQTSYKAMRAFRAPLVTIHLYTFFALALIIFGHIVAVVVTELREGGTIISAMFTGRKILIGQPKDI
jgi:Ni/Fe-hydrogenase 1 B-type cytochrome subunit